MPPRASRCAICRAVYRAERREVGKARRDRATWHPPAWVRESDRVVGVRVNREEAAWKSEVLWPGIIMATMLVASFLSALWFENLAAAVCFASLMWSLEQS